MKKYISTITKYLFSFIFVLLLLKFTSNIKYVIYSLSELACIFFVSNYLVSKSKWFNILNDIFMILFNSQLLVMYSGSSYITFVMLQSLTSLQDLEGKAFIYGLGVVLVLAFSCLPINSIGKGNKKILFPIPVFLILEAIIFFGNSVTYTPATGYLGLYGQWKDYQEIVALMAQYYSIQDENVNKENKGMSAYDIALDISPDLPVANGSFLDSGIPEGMKSKFAVGEQSDHYIIPEDTNIILIFIEGFSKNIITDDRNITPNIRNFINKSYSIDNYYNHTFATYRGLQGQLYSGVSLKDIEQNNLTSIMDVLKKEGYSNTFINTEPYNDMFSNYLNSLAFDNILTDENNCTGTCDSISDKESYKMLFDTAQEYYNKGNSFFLSMYSFGTHVSFDSPDERFGDGSYAVLNKFYNVDYQFGEFFNKFSQSPMADNTLLILTADHCTYGDKDFESAFQDYKRFCTDCDEIPLLFYYKGILTGSFNAEGRNSLDLAPTILDFMDIDYPNSFLGQSLFEAKNSRTIMDTFFWDPSYMKYTGNDDIENVDDDIKGYVTLKLTQYISEKQLAH